MSGSFRIEKAATSTPGRFTIAGVPGMQTRPRRALPSINWLAVITYNDPVVSGFMDLATTAALEKHPEAHPGLAPEPLCRRV